MAATGQSVITIQCRSPVGACELLDKSRINVNCRWHFLLGSNSISQVHYVDFNFGIPTDRKFLLMWYEIKQYQWILFRIIVWETLK